MNIFVIARRRSRRGNPVRRKMDCFVALLLAMTMTHAYAQEVPSLSVLADSSLAVPLSRTVRAYSASHNIAVSVAFADLADLEHQAVEGAVYDVLMTASPTLLASLKQRGVVDLNSEADVTANQLVFITSAANDAQFTVGETFPASNIIAALDFQPGLLLGNPETLYQGTLAREALKSYGVADDLEPYTLYEKNLDTLLESVASQGYYAIVYATDVAYDKRFRTIGAIPASRTRPIEYKAVALAGEKMDVARSFIGYLKQAEAKSYLEQ